jgi:hypothetical protein
MFGKGDADAETAFGIATQRIVARQRPTVHCHGNAVMLDLIWKSLLHQLDDSKGSPSLQNEARRHERHHK